MESHRKHITITRLGQTKDYNISICCLSAKHAALRRKVKDWLARNQDNVSEWANMSIRRIKMEGHKVMTKAHLAYAWLFSDCYVFSVTFHLYCTIEVSILTYNQHHVHSKYKIDLNKLKNFEKLLSSLCAPPFLFVVSTCWLTPTHYPDSEPTNLWPFSLKLRA
jgi:hypothetical protein